MFLLSLLRKHLSIQSRLCELNLRGWQQSPNHFTDFLSCLHSWPVLPLLLTNLPQTHPARDVPLLESNHFPGPQWSSEHCLTYPPSFTFYSRVNLGTVRGFSGSLNPSRLQAEPSVCVCVCAKYERIWLPLCIFLVHSSTYN